jgi:ribosomal protein S9
MTAVPIKQYDPGFINSVVHQLTGGQILYYLLHTWSQEPNRTVIIWCQAGDAAAKENAIRVALAKERKARGLPRTFELKFSTPWPYTHQGIKGEAIKVERTGGGMQTRMQAAFLAMQRKYGGTI